MVKNIFTIFHNIKKKNIFDAIFVYFCLLPRVVVLLVPILN